VREVFGGFGGCGEGYGEEVDGGYCATVLKNENWFMDFIRFHPLTNFAHCVPGY
jgi:hypothetical protein